MRNEITTVPNTQDLMTIPLVDGGRYVLTGKDMRKARSRVYALNKDNAAGWRWRTMASPVGKDRFALTVWKFVR